MLLRPLSSAPAPYPCQESLPLLARLARRVAHARRVERSAGARVVRSPRGGGGVVVDPVERDIAATYEVGCVLEELLRCVDALDEIRCAPD
eukprot:SAG25_NODE_2569_length_1527_cov_1.797619_1_plen_91_part_00